MDLSEVKIVADSSSDMSALSGVRFGTASLKIITSENEYVDNADLDVDKMIEDLAVYKGRVTTSCPSVMDWKNAFGDAKYVFCITLTSALSGTYNAACVAKKEYEREYPHRKVYVVDSLATGPKMKLMIDKLKSLFEEYDDSDKIYEKINEYQKQTELLFMLESLTNLRNSGRVNGIIAKIVGTLGIRIIGRASDKGELETVAKVRGQKHISLTLLEKMKGMKYAGGKVRIGHCQNKCLAMKLRKRLQEEFGNINVEVYKLRGLCSFYAEQGGLLIGFEKSCD